MLEHNNEELSKRPVEIAVEKPSKEEIEKIEKAAADKKAAELETEFKRKLDELDSERQQNAKEIERLKAENESLQSSAKIPESAGKKEKLKIYLEQIQTSFNNALNAISEFDSDEEKSNYRNILKKVISRISDLLEG